MNRFLAALAMFLLGSGVVAVLVGFLWDNYSWQTGIIAGAICWVVAFTVAVFVARGSDQ